MRRIYFLRIMLVLLAVAIVQVLPAQWSVHQSVLAEHDWYKIGVTSDGVYALDYVTLQSMGVDMSRLDPAKIRLFGNVQGALPEKNSSERYDDLSEAAILVTGSSDGSFDEGDLIMFYGQGPVNMILSSGSYYNYERNPYTDTIYYFLCVNSGVDGLRIGEQASVDTDDEDTVIDLFLDYYYHESDELSPYASGRAWYGDLFTGQEGFKEFNLDFPGVLPERGVRVESKVMGRCKPSASYSIRLNGTGVVVNHFIDEYQSREYGREHKVNKLAHPTSTPLTLRYEFESFEGNPILFIDYYVLNFWRELRFGGSDLAFGVIPSQLILEKARISIADATSSSICWEVTDPLHPILQQTEVEENGLFFGIEGDSERHYHLFDIDGVKQVASYRAISNQNLHGMETAEMLIIAPRCFWAQAQALADFHDENDGMDCVIADVSEIYNEFGTGTPDPTALRDFIRMLFLRSDGKLKYVLLLGKGTHDFRCLKGVDNNFVPIYEKAGKENFETESMCSDDYYALMDPDEGENCDGFVDLGVGRLPITTPEQGDAIIKKIKNYANPDVNHGLWKNNHLLMADNDSRHYPRYSEELNAVLDTAWPLVTVKKLYMDSYPVVEMASALRCPMANKVLMEYFDKGIGVMSYTGHGGVKSLSAEWVLALSDIQSMTNFDKLPFVHTATCEFSKFDDPVVVSGGELMLLNPSGGAIALLTTMRPTVSENNRKLSISLHAHLYDLIDGEHLRFGDIYRIAKSDPKHYHKSNIVYVLFGDPALRFSCPQYSILSEVVSGAEKLTVTGCITDQEGIIDTRFNGVLDLMLYDQKSKYTTLGLYDIPVNYSFFNDVLFEGKVSVTDGRFEAQVPLPSTIGVGNGKARLVYSAYDSIRKVEAGGVYDGFQVTAPTTIVDHQGPEIKLYWNTPDFQDGDVVSSDGVLCAELFDEHGIYHYNVSIGRDIVLNSNISGLDNLIMNDFYEPAIDDYQRGRIVMPLNDLTDGVYEFTLKVWDTWNNASEATIMLVVEHNTLIAEVLNYPNPFSDEVYFSFKNGDQTENLDVTLEVYDVLGRCVARHSEKILSVSGEVAPIRWDGRNSAGGELQQGVYFYKLSITDSKGKTKTVAHPMVKQ